MPASSGEMLNPSSLVIPDYTDLDVTKAEKGMLFISDAKLLFIDAVGSWKTITSS